MSNLYIITGPAGVGKSTISRKIAEQKNKSVLIEGDDIYHQVIGSYIPAWKEGNHLHIFWEICIKMTQMYLNNDYDVIFNYIINPLQLEYIRQNFKNYNIKFIILLADENTLLLRDKERPKDCQMKERCIELLYSFKNKDFNNENILDTSKLSIAETVSIIENEKRFILN